MRPYAQIAFPWRLNSGNQPLFLAGLPYLGQPPAVGVAVLKWRNPVLMEILRDGAVVRYAWRRETSDCGLALVIELNDGSWQPIATAPFDRALELAIIGINGVHALVFPSRRVLRGWLNAETNEALSLSPTHWREWAQASSPIARLLRASELA